MSTDQSKLHDLLAPFPEEHIGKLPRVTCGDCSRSRGACEQHKRQQCDICGAYVSTRHIHLDYVGHADVTRRLLEVDPAWQWEPVAIDDSGLPLMDTDERGNPVGLWIRLTVLGVSRLGYGSCPSNQNDAVKVLIGDALRNAAMRFGVALDLWAKGDRADPSAENAVSAPGRRAQPQARQQREASTLAEPTTDPEWLSRMEAAIGAASNEQFLGQAVASIRAEIAAGRVTKVHSEHLFHLYKQREGELAEARQAGEAA